MNRLQGDINIADEIKVNLGSVYMFVLLPVWISLFVIFRIAVGYYCSPNRGSEWGSDGLVRGSGRLLEEGCSDML